MDQVVADYIATKTPVSPAIRERIVVQTMRCNCLSSSDALT